jgi:hypothetical protein
MYGPSKIWQPWWPLLQALLKYHIWQKINLEGADGFCSLKNIQHLALV